VVLILLVITGCGDIGSKQKTQNSVVITGTGTRSGAGTTIPPP